MSLTITSAVASLDVPTDDNSASPVGYVYAEASDNQASPGNMAMIQQGCFKVYYSAGSLSIAEQLLEITQSSYPLLKGYFNADHDLCLDIYWADRNDWRYVPENKYPYNYGMPHMLKGTNHTHAVILPAANVDMPERLTNLIDPLLETSKLNSQELSDMKIWLGMSPGTTDQELRTYLSSSSFYVDYLVNIVHIHEIMHDFCYEFDIPENHNRNGQGKAWWVFEGLAQWSVLWVNRQLNNEHWADIHDLLYRWMYRTGKTDSGNIGPHEYSNYAWFHGILVEMFHQLETDYGEEYGPAVLTEILERISGKEYLTDKEMVAIFSEVAKNDLSQWFKNNWNIGDGTPVIVPPDYTLSIDKIGSGTVTSNPGGINCGSDCSQIHGDGTSVTLTATPDNNWNFSGWIGACSGTGTCNLTMNSNKSVTATFTDAFTPDITVTPIAISFGNVNIGSYIDETVTVKNDGNDYLIIGTILNLSSPFTNIADNCTGANLSPAASCTITLRFTPTSTSTFNSYFDIPSDDPDENPVSVQLRGTGTIPGSPDIAVLPGINIDYPPITIGSNADQTVTVKNVGNAPLSIFNITSPSGPFQITTDDCSNSLLNQNETCLIDIRLTASTPGTFTSSFTIPSDDPDENPVLVNIVADAIDSHNNSPTKPTLINPQNNSSNIPTTTTFEWSKCTDPDGDNVSYLIYYDTTPTFTGTTPIQIASVENKEITYAGIGNGTGFILFGIITIGSIKGRKKILIWGLMLIVTVTLIVSCGSGGTDGGGGNPSSSDTNITHIVSGLNSNTTYYWKVTGNDGKGGITESDTYSFITQ